MTHDIAPTRKIKLKSRLASTPYITKDSLLEMPPEQCVKDSPCIVRLATDEVEHVAVVLPRTMDAVDPQFERYFVTLHPGVPYRVTYTLRPCPRTRPHNEDNPERVATTEDEAIVAAAFSPVTYLDLGSTYRVELGNRLNRISWYRYGSKEQVLEGQDAGGGLARRRRELVGDSEMQPIPLVMQGSAIFTVEE
ncbi:uncharacterized protein CDV56_104292 [Aspergillus thermomutatus]|uniref:Uncharacterized protein n=1 Tax=Aspergillus thermomutatus TaxID=41047 RepID=A0A397HRB9_ASPTH|nr:uncharacterized protein CDV56_104292 [Aspergillus thermomutatus]RHZ63050.1 hypothetical protein CDV56_104292 [Aspergillus thermomutatus]